MEAHLIPGARFVDPKVLARVKDLELLARSVVDGFINGLHRAPYFGASIDFAAGRISRAPRWMQKTGLEWAFRLMLEPKRLYSRYARNAGFILSMLRHRPEPSSSTD